MAESATKALKSLELNDRDAEIRKTRRFSHVSVVGFDTWLQKYAIELTLRKCFASCGKILAVSFLKSVALIRFEGEDAVDNALQLSGTDVGGWTAFLKPVKAAPGQSKPFDYSAPRIKAWSGRAFITIEGEGCEEKALDLSGREVGGMNLVVEPPTHRPASPRAIKLELAKKKIEKNKKKKEKKKMDKENEMGMEMKMVK